MVKVIPRSLSSKVKSAASTWKSVKAPVTANVL